MGTTPMRLRTSRTCSAPKDSTRPASSPRPKPSGTRMGRRAAAIALASAATLSLDPAIAQYVRITPTLNVQETLSNNVNLQPSESARSDLITDISPGFSITARTARAQLSGTVSVPILLFARTGSENDRVAPQANVAGNWEVLDKFLSSTAPSTFRSSTCRRSGRGRRESISAARTSPPRSRIQVSPLYPRCRRGRHRIRPAQREHLDQPG